VGKKMIHIINAVKKAEEEKAKAAKQTSKPEDKKK
jgi:hypothetical protein